MEDWAGAERTESMYCMFVTLEVSKLSGWLNACALCRVQRQACMRAIRRARRREGAGTVAHK